MVRPNSSLTAHLVLKAIDIVAGEKQVDAMSSLIRQHFFTEAADIGNLNVLLEMSSELGIQSGELHSVVQNGQAMAALSADLRSAKDSSIKGSPSWVLNSGRQILYGNVGYRILNANIEELIKNPAGEASWC